MASLKDLRVGDIMITRFPTLTPTVPIGEAVALIVSKKLMGAPVVEGKDLVGVISEKDCLKILANWHFDLFNPVGGVVKDYMTTDLVTIDASMDFASITSLFLGHTYRGLPVVEGKQLVGLISRRDVLEAIERLGRPSLETRFPDYRRPA